MSSLRALVVPVLVLVLVLTWLPLVAAAGWQEVFQADSMLDLEQARQLALLTISEQPSSADAVVAAGWWSANLEHIDEPEAVLSAPSSFHSPELSFLLARIDATLADGVPSGVLERPEVAGPFGVFDTLDLERSVVPADHDLPPLGRRARSRNEPFRLLIALPYGWAGPPDPMLASGVYLVAWTLQATGQQEGWLVVEAQGGINLELDGHQVARLRDCGELDPSTTWYRISLAPGLHRLRLELASLDLPRVRVSLLNDTAGPLDGVAPVAEAEPAALAASSITPALAPASAALAARLAQEPPAVADLETAATLAKLYGDPGRQRRLLEQGLTIEPANQQLQLALAQLYLTEPTGAAPEINLQRCQELLRSTSELPGSVLLQRWLALKQDRTEDAERLLDQVLELAPDDPRVLEIWIAEAVTRGLPREAEESLERLRGILPASRPPVELQLEVLAGLERWHDRNQLLLALAQSEAPSINRVEQLASSCYQDQAFAMLQTLQQTLQAPSVDIGMIRLLTEAGRLDEARQALAEAEQRWGVMPAIDRLRLVISASQPDQLAPALAEVLERRPWNLDLRSLAWRFGEQPFYEPFQVDGMAVAAQQEEQVAAEEIDAVLLLDHAVERIYADGSSIYYYHGITRALTPTGATQAATLQHLPDSMVLNLRIIKPDGRVVVPPELQAGAVNIVLNDVKAGDLVEEEYLASLEPSGASRRGHLSPYTYRFADADRAFGLSEYLLVVPEEVDLQLDGNFTGVERQEWQEQGLRYIRWRTEQAAPIQREPFGPPNQELLPWVVYGFGVTWQDVGDAIRDRVLPILRGSPELTAWSQPLLDAADPQQAARQLVEALSDEVEPGRGALALGIPAGVSFSRKKGNRLAILATALAEAGWQVDLLLARPLALAGSHLKVPSSDTFFQPLLRASHQGQEIWFDPEEDRSGVNHISPILQGGDALLMPLTRLAEPSSYVERLPDFANPNLEERQTMAVTIDGEGNATVTFALLLHGAQAERMLQQLKSIPADRLGQVYHQLASRFFPAASAVTGDFEREPTGATLRFSFELPAACERSEQTMTCRSLVATSLLSPSLASLPERHYPLILQLPVVRRSITELVPPPGWTIERPPRRLDTTWGTVSEDLTAGQGRLHSELQLRIPAQVVEPEQYPDFARFCHAVDELLSRPPVLERTGR